MSLCARHRLAFVPSIFHMSLHHPFFQPPLPPCAVTRTLITVTDLLTEGQWALACHSSYPYWPRADKRHAYFLSLTTPCASFFAACMETLAPKKQGRLYFMFAFLHRSAWRGYARREGSLANQKGHVCDMAVKKKRGCPPRWLDVAFLFYPRVLTARPISYAW